MKQVVWFEPANLAVLLVRHSNSGMRPNRPGVKWKSIYSSLFAATFMRPVAACDQKASMADAGSDSMPRVLEGFRAWKTKKSAK